MHRFLGTRNVRIQLRGSFESHSEVSPCHAPLPSGQIAFGLVSIPVKLFSAAESSREDLASTCCTRTAAAASSSSSSARRTSAPSTAPKSSKGYEFSQGPVRPLHRGRAEDARGEGDAADRHHASSCRSRADRSDLLREGRTTSAPTKAATRAYTLLAKALRGDRPLGAREVRGARQAATSSSSARSARAWSCSSSTTRTRSARSTSSTSATPIVKDNELKMAVQLAEMGASRRVPSRELSRRSARAHPRADPAEDRRRGDHGALDRGAAARRSSI